MSAYQSIHTGERVDTAVTKIPENLPVEDSVIVIGDDGSPSYKAVSEIGDKIEIVQTTGTATDAVMSQKAVTDELNKNIKDGAGAFSLNQVQDGTTGTFDFTGKNPNATALDPTLTGQIPYGATGAFASSFGGKGAAQGKRSFQAGTTTIAKGNYSAAFGDNSVALGNDSFVEGYQNTSKGQASHSEGYSTQSIGKASHAEGHSTKAIGDASHAEGSETKAVGLNSHTEGWLSEANGNFSHVEGYKSAVKTERYTKPSDGSSGSGAGGDAGDSDPSWTAAEHRGEGSHASGILTQSSGYASHSEGLRTVADGHVSHAEGQQTYTTGWASHAEGNQTTAEGGGAHAEGGQTKAIGTNSHAEGTLTVAAGDSSHAEGINTEASGDYSHAGGIGTIAYNNQFVIGRYNKDMDNALFMVGNGFVIGASTTRINAFEVLSDGRAKVYGAPIETEDVVRKLELDTKYDKTGGTIGGNVIITGDLTVNGTQHINNTENLNVENAMIYSNAKGATLATNGGIGIKKNATDVYGIVYDPTSDSVNLGLGKSDANGVFTFNANEGQPVAIRDDSSKLVNDNLIKWDATNHKLVDSGKTVTDFVPTLPTSRRNQVYILDAVGNNTGLEYTYTAEAGTIAVRSTDGRLQVSTPSQDKDAANKVYADNLNARYVSTSILGG